MKDEVTRDDYEQLKIDYEDLLQLLIDLQEAMTVREECRLAVPVQAARLRKAKLELRNADQKVADLTVRVRHARSRKSP